MKNRMVLGFGALAVAGLVAVTGCKSSASSEGIKAKGIATSTAAAQAKANLKVISAKCGTVSAAGQLAAAKDMTSHAGREALFTKCGIPASKRSAVETQALAAAEKAHLVSGGHTARVTYFTVTLPKIVEANQS